MDPNISDQIAHLPGFSRHQLLALWQKLYGRAAPAKIRRSLMVPFLGYRLQERAYGGLKPSTRAELRRVARALESAAGSTSSVLRPRMKPGTRIVRQWRGKMYEVSVTESGFEYAGVSYLTLSEIARQITGTRWSGPPFFGLNKEPSVRERGNE